MLDELDHLGIQHLVWVEDLVQGSSKQASKQASRHSSFPGSSTSAKSFFVHHTQQLAAAAQVGDAKGIRKKITEMKMRLIKDALKATGQG